MSYCQCQYSFKLRWGNIQKYRSNNFCIVFNKSLISTPRWNSTPLTYLRTTEREILLSFETLTSANVKDEDDRWLVGRCGLCCWQHAKMVVARKGKDRETKGGGGTSGRRQEGRATEGYSCICYRCRWYPFGSGRDWASVAAAAADTNGKDNTKTQRDEL
jgi:hypothetical protein